MRKDLDDMTPGELRRERAKQEERFQHLISHMPTPDDSPKTWYGRWWRKRSDLVKTTAQIILWTGLICVGAYVAGWFAILCATSL